MLRDNASDRVGVLQLAFLVVCDSKFFHGASLRVFFGGGVVC